MQLRNLKVFCDVVGRHSFSRAAADNDMTQSGASQAVQQLEEYLDVQLIDRSKRPFLLTAQGNAFYSGCVKLLRQFESLTDEVRSLGKDVTGRSSVAAIYSVGLSYLPELQKVVKSHYPKAEVRFQFGHPDEVYRLVEQGVVDFGLVSYPQSSTTISSTAWREEHMVLAAASNHALADGRRIEPEDLSRESLVAFAPNLRIRHEIDRYLRHLGITMQIAAELDNIDSVRHAMEVNSAVAFLPRPSIQEEIDKGNVVGLNCPWLDLKRPLALIFRKNDTMSRATRGIMELVLQQGDPPRSDEPTATETAGHQEPAAAVHTPSPKGLASQA